MSRNANQDIFLIGLCVLDEDVEVVIVIKDPCIKQLVFRPVIASPLVLFAKILVRKCFLRIFVEGLAVAVRWQRIKIIELFFDVFAVVAFRIA